MRNISGRFRQLHRLVSTLLSLIIDPMLFPAVLLTSSPALAAENLFLRKQLALYEG